MLEHQLDKTGTCIGPGSQIFKNWIDNIPKATNAFWPDLYILTGSLYISLNLIDVCIIKIVNRGWIGPTVCCSGPFFDHVMITLLTLSIILLRRSPKTLRHINGNTDWNLEEIPWNRTCSHPAFIRKKRKSKHFTSYLGVPIIHCMGWFNITNLLNMSLTIDLKLSPFCCIYGYRALF